jgi:hypothetical protein
VINVISLGAGVQSSTMALMAAHGEITPMPDCAIFADTQHEPKAVMVWLDWLEKQLPYPVYRVTRGDLWKSATTVRRTRDGKRTYIKTAIPVHMVASGGDAGIAMRTCTFDYKIDVINRKIQELLGVKRITKKYGVLAKVWIGISTDEAKRMKPHRKPWAESRWPLIEIGMSRADCLVWMEKKGYRLPPRSACTFCPFRDDESWLALTPQEFGDAVEKEKELQAAYAETTEIVSVPYLHQSRVPLSEVQFKPGRMKEKRDQITMFSDFNSECEGMCGV